MDRSRRFSGLDESVDAEPRSGSRVEVIVAGDPGLQSHREKYSGGAHLSTFRPRSLVVENASQYNQGRAADRLLAAATPTLNRIGMHRILPATLDAASPGRFVITEIEGDHSAAIRMKSLGLCQGRSIELVSVGDPMIVRVAGTRVGLSRTLATLVCVEEVNRDALLAS